MSREGASDKDDRVFGQRTTRAVGCRGSSSGKCRVVGVVVLRRSVARRHKYLCNTSRPGARLPLPLLYHNSLNESWQCG